MSQTAATSLAAAAILLAGAPAIAADLIVSGNDGKFVRVEGAATYPSPAPSDSLAIIDASQFPPVVKAVVEGVDHTISGPPQAVAITPDGKLAVVGAPSRYDYQARKETFETYLRPVDLSGATPRLLPKIELGAHSNGLAISPDGKLLLAACTDGTLKVLHVDGTAVTLAETIKIDERRLSGVSFTHDGKSVLVARRDTGGVAVLDVVDGVVKPSREMVSSGVGPYAIDISSDGRWAVVGNAGLAGLAGGLSPGDVDLVTLVDVSKRPFRAVQHLTVPAVPEGVALSPDGKWLAVNTLNGTNLKPTDPGPGRQKVARVVLFALGAAGATRVNDLPAGEGGQGIVFAKDSKTVLVQFNVEKQLAIFQVEGGKLVDTGRRLQFDAGPVTIRSMPR
jgi:DNA-binding beta-propeller fold protein YncE